MCIYSIHVHTFNRINKHSKNQSCICSWQSKPNDIFCTANKRSMLRTEHHWKSHDPNIVRWSWVISRKECWSIQAPKGDRLQNWAPVHVVAMTEPGIHILDCTNRSPVMISGRPLFWNMPISSKHEQNTKLVYHDVEEIAGYAILDS